MVISLKIHENTFKTPPSSRLDVRNSFLPIPDYYASYIYIFFFKLFINLEPVNHIVELSDSFFMQNEKPINTQFILVDGTISSREDSVLCFKFSFEKLKEHVEVVVVDPNNKKHMLKTMDKCKCQYNVLLLSVSRIKRLDTCHFKVVTLLFSKQLEELTRPNKTWSANLNLHRKANGSSQL